MYCQNIFICLFKPLPNHKNSDMTELKAFENDKSEVSEMKISLSDRVENTVGKYCAGFQHFLLFPVFFRNLLR